MVELSGRRYVSLERVPARVKDKLLFMGSLQVRAPREGFSDGSAIQAVVVCRT